MWFQIEQITTDPSLNAVARCFAEPARITDFRAELSPPATAVSTSSAL